MKLSKKLIVTCVFLIACASYWHHIHHIPKLISYRTALDEFEKTHDQSTLEQRKQRVVQYYLSGEYDKDAAHEVAKAIEYFKPLMVQPTDAIVFDVDDTALYNYNKMDRFEFLWSQQPELAKVSKGHNSPAIKPVLDLYNFLRSKGYKLIFLTSRNEGQYAATKKELENAGYHGYEKLMLMPDVLAFDRNIKTEDWKYQVRQGLAKTYRLVGCVGDRSKDFEYGCTGYVVKLPNYLY